MKTVVIDGRHCKTREQTHEYLAKQSCFPPYYGKNLDALHDVLTSICEPTHFLVRYSAEIKTNLGNYGKTLLHVFEESAGENKNITAEIEE